MTKLLRHVAYRARVPPSRNRSGLSGSVERGRGFLHLVDVLAEQQRKPRSRLGDGPDVLPGVCLSPSGARIRAHDAQPPPKHDYSLFPETVYTFAANPDNLTKWAAGLVQDKVTHDGELLCVESPKGRTTICFAGRNSLGVLDHDVTLPSGETINNPFRVLAHPEGAEVLFTLRQLGLSDTEFDRDAGPGRS